MVYNQGWQAEAFLNSSRVAWSYFIDLGLIVSLRYSKARNMGPPLRWMLDTPFFTAFVSSHLQGRLLEGDGEYPVYRVLKLVFGAGHRMLGIFDIQTDEDDIRI